MTTPNRRLACFAVLFCLHASASFSTGAVDPAPRSWAQLSGDYRDGQQSVRLHADGRFDWQATYVPAGTDAGVAVSATGQARLDAGALFLVVDERSLATAHGGPVPAGAKALLPARLHPVQVSGRVLLLDENAINDVANRVNAFGRSPVDASPYLHRVPRGAADAGPLEVRPEVLLPRAFAHRLLAAPLQGKVLAIEAVAEQQVNVAGWMQPAVWRTQHSARLVIDLGTSRGVFEGMRLYVGSARQVAVVQRARADQCQAQIVWIDGAPQVGSTVSSAFK